MKNLKLNIHELNSICNLFFVDKMYLFGSVLQSNFNDTSDVDILVKFKEMDLKKYFDNYLNLKNQLEKITGRKVDLVEEQTVKNPVLKKSIDQSKELIYG